MIAERQQWFDHPARPDWRAEYDIEDQTAAVALLGDRQGVSRRTLADFLQAMEDACLTVVAHRQEQQQDNLEALNLNPAQSAEYAAIVGRPERLCQAIQWFGQVLCAQQGLSEKRALELIGVRHGQTNLLDQSIDMALRQLSEEDNWHVADARHKDGAPLITYTMADMASLKAGVDPAYALLFRRRPHADVFHEGKTIAIFKQSVFVVLKSELIRNHGTEMNPDLLAEFRRIEGVTERDSELAKTVGAFLERVISSQQFTRSPFISEASWYLQLFRGEPAARQ